MSHLLKRTKKSCMKIIRKISSSKQMFAKKCDDDSADDTINNNNNNNNNSNNTNANALNNDNSLRNSNLNGNKIRNGNGNGNGFGKKANNRHNDYEMEIAKIETQPLPGERVNHSFRRSTESLPSTTTYQNQQQHQQQLQHSSPRKIPYNGTEQLLEGEDSPNNTILHKLTARLFLTADGYDFQRLQQLRSDTGSEIIQFDNEAQQQQHQLQHRHNDDDSSIVFEKVNFKDDVRYFRHTPSNSSLDNFRPSSSSIASTPDYDQADYDLDNDWQVNEECNHRPWNLEPLSQQFTNFGFQATSAAAGAGAAASTTSTTTAPQKDAFHSTVNVTLGSKLNGNLQNVVISQAFDNRNKLTPVIKWDINGNSLDDDDNDLLPHEYLEDFDKRLSKRIAAVQQLQMKERELYNDDESADSSLHSSSTTLETWVDEDLLIENSIDLNSQENRCLILKA